MGFYNKSFETQGKRIKDVESEYEKLTTTRTKQLSNIVGKISELDKRDNAIEGDSPLSDFQLSIF